MKKASRLNTKQHNRSELGTTVPTCPSLTGRSTRTPLQAMPPAFSWPVAVPSALRAPVGTTGNHHRQASLSADGRYVLAWSERDVTVVSVASGKRVLKVPAATIGQRLPNGRWLIHHEIVTFDKVEEAPTAFLPQVQPAFA